MSKLKAFLSLLFFLVSYHSYGFDELGQGFGVIAIIGFFVIILTIVILAIFISRFGKIREFAKHSSYLKAIINVYFFSILIIVLYPFLFFAVPFDSTILDYVNIGCVGICLLNTVVYFKWKRKGKIS